MNLGDLDVLVILDSLCLLVAQQDPHLPFLLMGQVSLAHLVDLCPLEYPDLPV